MTPTINFFLTAGGSLCGGHCADGDMVGGLWLLVLYWGFHSERLVCLGLGGSGVSWGLHHLGGNPIDMDSNIKYDVMFVFLFQKLCPRLRHEIIIGTEKKLIKVALKKWLLFSRHHARTLIQKPLKLLLAECCEKV